MAGAQTYLSKCISQKRSIYSNRTVSYVIVLLELLTVLLEYIDLSVIPILISKNSYYYTNIPPIMLALCSMLSDTYYAHNYASIIGESLLNGVGSGNELEPTTVNFCVSLINDHLLLSSSLHLNVTLTYNDLPPYLITNSLSAYVYDILDHHALLLRF